MDRRVSEQPAWLIHQRPYRESSLILEFLTRDFGRVSGVSRGARRRGKNHTLLAQFVPFQISWSGNGALKSINAVEPVGSAVHLRAERLASGLYLNELLMRALRPHDACESVYREYSEAVSVLASSSELHGALRHFEAQLLMEMGYGVSFTHCLDGRRLHPDRQYRLENLSGFVEVLSAADASESMPGCRLLEIGRGEFGSAETRALARRIFQSALAPHIGSRPLQSRRLLRARQNGVRSTTSGV